MQYTTLGKRTGLRVSVLGFGAMRLPMVDGLIDRDKALPMLHAAMDAGVNYLDTAVFYCNQDSQSVVGEALVGRRDGIVVSTKNHNYLKHEQDAFLRNLEDSLKRLRVDTIDIYHLHGLNWKSFAEHVDCAGGSYRWMLNAKEQGLIRHICFSFHDTPEALERIASSGLFDVVTCQYNLLDTGNGKAFAAIARLGMGIVVMGPVAGGRLGAPSEALRTLVPGAGSVPEVAMRFVLANPHVNVALSGMSTMEQVTENVRTCSIKTPLTAAEKRRVAATLKRYHKLAELYCTGCKYCMPCPAGVDIPANFDNFNKHRVYGLTELARNAYAANPHRASLCVACGRCMNKCPQHIDIVRQLRDTVRTLDDAYGKLAVTVRPEKVEILSLRRGRLRLSCRAVCELTNLSDEDITPSIDWKTGEGVTTLSASRPPDGHLAIAGFERTRQGVNLSFDGPLGQSFRVEPSVASCRETVAAGTLWQFLPATLRDTPPAAAHAVHVNAEEPATRRRTAAAANHDVSLRAAYGSDALRLWLDFPTAAKRGGAAKSLVHTCRMDLDLRGFARPRGNEPPALGACIVVESPDAADADCRLKTPGHGNLAKQIVLRRRGSHSGRSVSLRIPWQALNCAPPRPGQAMALKASCTTPGGGGKPDRVRRWGAQGGWIVFGPKGNGETKREPTA